MNKVLNIYQIYIMNSCRFGFYVHRDSWHPLRYAKITAIEGVEEGKMIEGKPPYFGVEYFLQDIQKQARLWDPEW